MMQMKNHHLEWIQEEASNHRLHPLHIPLPRMIDLREVGVQRANQRAWP